MDRKEGSFTKFPDLPLELRWQIWGEAMGGYGLYLVDCRSVLVDGNGEQDGFRTHRLGLRPVHHKSQVDVVRQRVHTQRTLLATCVESRTEFCRRFPDTLGGGGLRFSFRHDLIYIESAFILQAFCSLKLPPEQRPEFEGGWHRLIHRLAVNCDFCQIWAVLLSGPGVGIQRDWNCTRLNRFMTFLTTCTSLRQLVLTRPDGIGFDEWAQLSPAVRTTLCERMTGCYAGLTCQASERFHVEAVNFDGTALFLRQIILDEFTLHPNWVGKVRTGYPVLRDLKISKMVRVSRELRWLCKDI